MTGIHSLQDTFTILTTQTQLKLIFNCNERERPRKDVDTIHQEHDYHSYTGNCRFFIEHLE